MPQPISFLLQVPLERQRAGEKGRSSARLVCAEEAKEEATAASLGFKQRAVSLGTLITVICNCESSRTPAAPWWAATKDQLQTTALCWRRFPSPERPQPSQQKKTNSLEKHHRVMVNVSIPVLLIRSAKKNTFKYQPYCQLLRASGLAGNQLGRVCCFFCL